MNLYLLPNDPEHTVLVSTNGVAHYRIRTSKTKPGLWVSRIQRPAESEEASIVAEVEWKSLVRGTPTVVRCPLLPLVGATSTAAATSASVMTMRRKAMMQRRTSGPVRGRAKSKNASLGQHRDGRMADPAAVPRRVAKRGNGVVGFLFKRNRFSSSRYFIGNDGVEYKWKSVSGVGCMLTRSDTDEQIAEYVYSVADEGLFAGEKKAVLHIEPCSTLDIDLVILSFMIMEKKRRDRAGDGSRLTAHFEDPQGDGGGGEVSAMEA